MKLILALTYNIDLENWDVDYINNIVKIYDKVFRSIVLQL